MGRYVDMDLWEVIAMRVVLRSNITFVELEDDALNPETVISYARDLFGWLLEKEGG